MRNIVVASFVLLLPALLAGEETVSAAAARPEPVRTWTVNMQGGFASTFQMVLGGTFGQGPDWQDRLTISANNLLRSGDSFSVFGWSTTDLPTSTPNWQAGLLYKNRVLKTRRQTLSLGGGVQRWVLPIVKTGALDWVAAGNLNYTTFVKRLPVTVTQDSWSLLRSRFPTGSVLYTQIYTQHNLRKSEGLQLSFRHGPAHTYSWGFWGAEGNRVVRYSAMLVANWKGTTFEAGVRQQFGLQDGICNNRLWSFLITRQFTGPFASQRAR